MNGRRTVNICLLTSGLSERVQSHGRRPISVIADLRLVEKQTVFSHQRKKLVALAQQRSTGSLGVSTATKDS
jgi:hypothetical protein